MDGWEDGCGDVWTDEGKVVKDGGRAAVANAQKNACCMLECTTCLKAGRPRRSTTSSSLCKSLNLGAGSSLKMPEFRCRIQPGLKWWCVGSAPGFLATKRTAASCRPRPCAISARGSAPSGQDMI
eukprot:365574-Chlamydomonas_euryale.AAC.16